MTIIILKDKKRKLPVRAIIRRKGHPTLMQHFPGNRQGWKDAELWEAEQQRNIRLIGMPLTIDELKKHTVKEIVERYLREVTPSKGSSKSETTVLKKFLKADLAKKSLAFVTKQDGYDYRTKRLKETWKGEPISPSTVRREVNSLQRVFEVAKEEWGFPNLINPFRGLTIKGGEGISRERILKDGELRKLEKACKKSLTSNSKIRCQFIRSFVQEISDRQRWSECEIKLNRSACRDIDLRHWQVLADRMNGGCQLRLVTSKLRDDVSLFKVDRHQALGHSAPATFSRAFKSMPRRAIDTC